MSTGRIKLESLENRKWFRYVGTYLTLQCFTLKLNKLHSCPCIWESFVDSIPNSKVIVTNDRTPAALKNGPLLIGSMSLVRFTIIKADSIELFETGASRITLGLKKSPTFSTTVYPSFEVS